MPVLRRILREVVSAWCWVYLLSNTITTFTIGLVGSAFRDSFESFGAQTRAWARGNMRFGMHVCEVEPHEPIPAAAVLLVNHQHFFDIPLIAALVSPPLFFVARVEVLHVPLIGSVLRRGGHVLIARGSGAANEAALEEAARRIAAGGRVVFFGEGTRSKDGTILTMRSGAFRLAVRTGAPIVPLVLAGTRFTFPAGLWPIVPSRMAAAFLPPRRVTDEQARSTPYREALRDEMAAVLARLAPRTGPRM